MCALAVPVEQPKSLDHAVCVYQKDMASRIMSNASNTRFTHAQIQSSSNIDWLTMYQDHHDKAGTLRKVNHGMTLSLEDLSTISEEFFDDYSENFEPTWHDGVAYKELWRSFKKYLVEGSHSTRLMLFCDGTRVFISGNIGRWGRSDNLFNLKFKDVIAKANRILAEFGLPPFTKGKSEVFRSNFDGKTIRSRICGAVVTRIDINVNFATGSASNAQYLIDYLQARSMSYVSKSVSGRSSVQWGKKGGRLYTKAYVKHEEMLAHCRSKDRESLLESFAYKYAKEKGIVRIETEIDRKTLYETGLRDLENIDMAVLASIAKNKIDQLLDDVPVGLQHFEPQKLFTKKEHRKYLRTFCMWKTGMDLMDFDSPIRPIGKTTFYEHKDAILELTGIDISQRYIEGVTDTNIAAISQITLEPLHRPSGYSMDVDWENMEELKVIDLTKHLPTRRDINDALTSAVPTQEFLNIDLSEPNHALIAKRNAEAKERYQMRKLYEIKNEDKRSH